MDVHFLDTTFRDGSQSLWASGIRYGMMEAVAGELDRAGFAHIEVPANPIFFKKMVRDLRENPWDVMRMLAREIRETPKACMYGAYRNLNTFGAPTPPVLGTLFLERMAEIGVLDRAQLVCNTADQLTRSFPAEIPRLRELGMEIALALSYTVSPRHTDSHYAEKVRQAASFRPDVIYLKDQGGLLTIDRLRTLLPTILAEAGDIPVELHSHCTTGLAPLVYLEALNLGVETLHCGVPPLANGSAQPSVLETAHNARVLGHHPAVDVALIEAVAEKLTSFARQDGLPLGNHTPYDAAQYEHQIPGGVISNLQFQLDEAGLAGRLDEVLEECIQIRRELGYPIMITPYSQYVCTQAAVNVATGERYRSVIDPLIRFAQGAFGEDSGYLWMDQDLRDRFLGLPRADELDALHERPMEDVSLAQAREMFGGPTISDEELVLRAILQGGGDVEKMYAAGPPRRYEVIGGGGPLASLLDRLEETRRVRYVQIRWGHDALTLDRRSTVPAGSTASASPDVRGEV